MAEKKELSFGDMRRKAFQYDSLIEDLTQLIHLSTMRKTELIRKTGLSHSHFERRLKEGNLTNNQLAKIFRVIVEENNLLRAKTH